ncbi:cell wall-associated protease [Parageobacillus genomosp. 1]|uniref:Cell wall-associated protease n=1 Tax=Parageobacillus genomosp. 1 TaxID=1295642 RepID=A0ABC9VAU4_9BACL|nr:Ig-like domain-containing protein [Parageobacillus genomosp. 1]EZP75254.1 cell wall-associated protease [Parageobacillus genomosp. 1]
MKTVTKHLFILFISFLFSIMYFTPSFTENAHAAGNVLKLTSDLLSSSTDDDLYWDEWSDSESFEDSNGRVIDEGFGFEPSYYNEGWMYAEFDIHDYNYTTLETTISLENKWRTGDRGKTEFVIYADNQKIFSKTFTNKTPSQQLKLPIPKGTAKLTFYVLMEKGSQGNHGAIFGYPRLTNALPPSPSVDKLSLVRNIGAAETSYYRDVYFWDWGNRGPFELTDGSLVPTAVAFEPYFNDTTRMYAAFKVEDYTDDYSTLETQISLENGWRTGDLGKTEAIIYADNVKLYSKTFTNTTPIQNVKLSLPKGTKYITFFAVQEHGNQGNHGLIFVDPVLTKERSFLPADHSLALAEIGTSETSYYRDVYYGKWYSLAFQMAEGNLVARGYGLSPYFDDASETYATFYVGDYQYPTLETKISLDNKWRTGDRGKSVVYIYADDKLIYNKTFDNKTPTQNVIAAIPSKTEYIQFRVRHLRGKSGLTHGVIFENPLLTNRPNPPSVNEITDKTTIVTGKARPNTLVKIKVNGKTIASTKANSSGTFSVKIPIQKQGTEVFITATNIEENKESIPTKIVVKKAVTITAPQVNPVSDRDTKVTGKTKAGAKVIVKAGSVTLGEATAGKDGKFSITIKAQKAGTVLLVIAMDKTNNTSATTKVTVQDKTPPIAPQVNRVTDRDTKVTGKTEANAKVVVKAGKNKLGEAKAGKDGRFSVKIKAQKAGTILEVVSIDASGNISKGTKIKVQK